MHLLASSLCNKNILVTIYTIKTPRMGKLLATINGYKNYKIYKCSWRESPRKIGSNTILPHIEEQKKMEVWITKLAKRGPP